MIDTGDWMTAREIPYDFAFLEKPPLKFWLVGAPIRLGLLPRTEFGFRAVDALLGAIAFGYVALLGYPAGRPGRGVASCLILFGLRDLVLVHGLRTNNMEASLVAAYAGGALPLPALAARRRAPRRADHRRLVHARLPHQVRRRRVPPARRGRSAWRCRGPACCPSRCGPAWPTGSGRRRCSSASRRRGSSTSIVQFGDTLIETMFLQHVFARFTGALDPQHLQPWDYYYRGIARMLEDARCQWLVAARRGAAALSRGRGGATAWPGRWWSGACCRWR